MLHQQPAILTVQISPFPLSKTPNAITVQLLHTWTEDSSFSRCLIAMFPRPRVRWCHDLSIWRCGPGQGRVVGVEVVIVIVMTYSCSLRLTPSETGTGMWAVNTRSLAAAGCGHSNTLSVFKKGNTPAFNRNPWVSFLFSLMPEASLGTIKYYKK